MQNIIVVKIAWANSVICVYTMNLHNLLEKEILFKYIKNNRFKILEVLMDSDDLVYFENCVLQGVKGFREVQENTKRSFFSIHILCCSIH